MSLLWVTWAWICALVCGLLKNIGPWMMFWGYVQLFLLHHQMLICSPRHFWTSFQCLSFFAGGWLECGFALLYLAFKRIFGHLWCLEGMSSFFRLSSDAHLQPKAFLNIISMSLCFCQRVTWAWICALVSGLQKNIWPWMTFWRYVQLFLVCQSYTDLQSKAFSNMIPMHRITFPRLLPSKARDLLPVSFLMKLWLLSDSCAWSCQ